MPTDKRRLAIITEDWMWDAVEHYRHEHHIMSMSKAAAELVEIGLKAEQSAIQKPETPKKPEPRKLDEAKIRKHVKALCDLLSVEESDPGSG